MSKEKDESSTPSVAEAQITEKLVLKDFIRFAQEKKLNMKCPSCDQAAGWKVYSHKQGNLVIPKGAKGDIFIGLGVDVIGMRCNHCGYIKQYDLSVVSTWLETEGKEHGQ